MKKNAAGAHHGRYLKRKIIYTDIDNITVFLPWGGWEEKGWEMKGGYKNQRGGLDMQKAIQLWHLKNAFHQGTLLSSRYLAS